MVGPGRRLSSAQESQCFLLGPTPITLIIGPRVASIREFLKRQALTRLPERWLRPLKARHYERILRTFNEEEEPELAIVRFLVDAGTTTVDLGANIGVYTKVLSSLCGPTGRVISVEPVPETFRILSHNVHSLNMPNVELVNAAVSDRNGRVTMEVPVYDSGGANFYQARIVEATVGRTTAKSRVEVRTVTLDEIASSSERLSFVKCDVEGHEYKCLAGAESTIAKHYPAWLIEVWGDPDRADSNARRLFDLLEGNRYRCWVFDGARISLRSPGVTSTNYFFLTDDHESRVLRGVSRLGALAS